MLTVLLGGARSGKSSAAVSIGERRSGPVVYIATSPHIHGDGDLDARIAVHRAERPDSWRTIEEEIDLTGAIAGATDALVIVDCLTVWVGNLLHHGHEDAAVLTACDAALDAARSRTADTLVITNEVGLGIVPDNELARRYRDLLGRINQRWVSGADRAYLMVAGRALPLSDLGDHG
jgi:adenosyl cobinamide kinase/adenosyl cobinamide phosphate guanylyltransferase